jgi:hypothetical protein
MPNVVGAGPLDREYLYELALILDNAETDQTRYGIDEQRFIKIEVNTAKDIASRLRGIANRLPTTVH